MGQKSLTQNIRRLTMEYRITVQGHLAEHWADRLGNMNNVSIRHTADAQRTAQTTLLSEVIGQAALWGVLNMLYDLHLPLLSVECLSDEAYGLH